MTRGMKFTLFAIAFFFLFVAGSFIWFAATWDPEREEPVVSAPLEPARIGYAWNVHGMCMECASPDRRPT